MSSNGFPNTGQKSEFARVPAGQVVNCRFTHEKKDNRHYQECAEHKPQHPGCGHVVSQKAREQVAERHPTLLSQKHDRENAAAVRIRGKKLIGGVAGIKGQQPASAAGDQYDQAQDRCGGEAEEQSDDGKGAHSQRDEVVAGVVGGNTGEQEGSKDRTQADR